MISGLLHGRILGSPPSAGLAANPAYVNILGYHVSESSASANSKFKILTNGTWLARGDSYPDQSGNYYLPATVGIGSSYEVKITATLTSGPAGTVVNPAASFVAISSDREITFNLQRFTLGLSVSTYNVLVEIRPTGGSVESSHGFTVRTSAEMLTSGGGGCPSDEMFVSQAKQIKDLGIGASIESVILEESEAVIKLKISSFESSQEKCFRIVTRNGSACVVSESTPFTLRHGGTKLAGEMLGEHVLRDDPSGALKWDKVVSCAPVGILPVKKVSIGGHSFLCGEHPQMRILSHNFEKT